MSIRPWLPGIVFLLLTACAQTGPITTVETGSAPVPVAGESEAPSADQETMRWWSVAFHPDWPQDDGPAWYVDTFLAHRILAGIVSAHSDEVTLWRFHRRAVRDATGHRFSFIFYCSQSVAERVNASIDTNGTLKQLLALGVVGGIEFAPGASHDRSGIPATSDPTWSAPLQASWPYFAMGVSQSWLSLIDNVVSKLQMNERNIDLEEALEFYRVVNAKVTQHWRLEGEHAYLHHLNALFGYQDIYVSERRLMRF